MLYDVKVLLGKLQGSSNDLLIGKKGFAQASRLFVFEI